jgi:cellulose synthase/poly-beta-1,6-N-acetylglucosamine synthase-like glycosyltransferase
MITEDIDISWKLDEPNDGRKLANLNAANQRGARANARVPGNRPDALLDRDTAAYLVAPLIQYPHVGAVTGNPRIRTAMTPETVKTRP